MTGLTNEELNKFVAAVHDRKPVKGLTHFFYKYPARFSPIFARTAIETFTKPGEVVFDPFMGGGTTLVEASALGRLAVGTDINSLAAFVTKVKTTPLSEKDINEINLWISNIDKWLHLWNYSKRQDKWRKGGYQNNLNTRNTWPTRKLIELALSKTDKLSNERQKDFIRCAVLKTSQWALDCRKEIPTASDFRRQFVLFYKEMVSGIREYRKSRSIVSNNQPNEKKAVIRIHKSVIDIKKHKCADSYFPPRLILTSPPYPGVHVLYHRWQINGRKETAAPYWIANALDGNGASFYTFGDRKQSGLSNYFSFALDAYRTLANISDHETIMVQLVAFSDQTWQLPMFLEVLSQAGFCETKIAEIANSRDGRLWRNVPSRKFYAEQKGDIAASKEVLLMHRLR